jgi:polysaccharide deacetylase family protein (PEP-CTERM system associated)
MATRELTTTRVASDSVMASRNQECIFSVDVEDWFHILDLPSTPPIEEWEKLPSRVERNFMRLLDILSEHKVQITCFFLGWVAQKYPSLVREAQSRGHETASHGYSHQLVYRMTPDQFLEDSSKAKKILEDITGEAVWGFRSSGFSVTEDSPWFFEQLVRAGYFYDSSVFPGPRAHGGMKTNRYAPYRIGNHASDLLEFPITVTRVLGRPLCFFGGGYLRLFPYALVKRMAHKVLKEGRPVIFYVHPREIDPSHPRLPMNRMRSFKSYVNLGTTEDKIRRLLSEFSFKTFRNALKDFAYVSEARTP